jgi:hypothetical protein
MAAMTDPRTTVTYRIPAADLRPGDLVDTAANGNEWQEVLHVYRSVADLPSGASVEDVEDADDADDVAAADDATALRGLVEAAGGRYVVVQLTDIAAIDAGVYFEDGVAMAAGEDDDQPMADVIGTGVGLRTYLYTKYELVTVRQPQG